jgi:hypothetical protein
MELNKEKKMKSEQAVLPNPCLEEEEEEEKIVSNRTKIASSLPLSTFTEAHHDSFGTTIICLYFP